MVDYLKKASSRCELVRGWDNDAHLIGLTRMTGRGWLVVV